MAKRRRKKKKELDLGIRAIGEYRGVRVVVQRDSRFPKNDWYMWCARAGIGYSRSFNDAKYAARAYIDENIRGCEITLPVPIWNQLKHIAWHEAKMDIEEFAETIIHKFMKVRELRKKKEHIQRRKEQLAFNKKNGVGKKKKAKKKKKKKSWKSRV